jgi:alpha-tubulin suppressor-like RCC1 family protein/tRNA A-37 threonylcarbamoyl transferase component Bud32
MLGDIGANVATTDLESEYEILGELGRGATAVVYRARDRELGREVAIKVIRPKYADDDETVARLAREARTVAQLQHPNIVTLYAVRRIRDGSLALVMQLVPGRTLREILNDRGPCTFERTDRVLRDIASALSHAHERGFVHRDVKPENIFIDETTGQAMLSDFGVARSLEPDSQLTATGTAIGTPSYMSPEQIDGTDLDGRSDLYSLGLVGWEMLTGQRPWDGEGLYSVIYKQKHEELPPIDELRGDTPDRLIYLVEGATRKNPAERWSNATEMLAQASTIVPEGGWARWHSERRKRRRTFVYSAARERGDSILSAALETMRFRRDGSTPVVSPVAPPPRAARRATDRDDTPAPLPASVYDEAIAATSEDRPRRSVVSLLFVAAIVAAAIVGTLKVMRGRATPATDAAAPTTFADNGGVEVPIARQPPTPDTPAAAIGPDTTLPNAAAQSALATGDTASSRGADSVQSPDVGTPPAKVAASRDGAAAAPKGGKSAEPTAQRSTASSGEVNRAAADRTQLPPAPVLAVPASSTASPGAAPASVGDSGPKATSTTAVAAVAFPAEHGIVAAGGRHSCALETNGSAYCWGANDQGQLGDGTRDDHTEPAVVAGDLTFSQLSAGASHTCAVSRDGDAYCWGNNDRGQLGDATTLERDTPVRVAAPEPFKAVRAGFSHSCALARRGEVSCWGSNAYGQLGTGAGLTSARAAEVSGDLRFGALAVGWNHTCAITVGGDLYCWGSNNGGQIGDGTHDDRRTPTKVGAETRFISVAAGNQHTCAVSTGGELYCWGRNNYGQLATGQGDRAQPTRVYVGGTFTTVTAGAVHSCAKTTSGQVFCWGRNTFGQLGDGTTIDRVVPVYVAGIPPVAVVQATGSHTCAATAAGETYCWGYNVEGQLGDGSRNHRSRPARVSAPPR